MRHVAAPTRVAFDVGPLHGHRTGIGTAVASLLDALGTAAAVGDDTIELVPYLLSARAGVRRSDGVRRLPMPAALAHRLWARSDRPRLDRWFGDVDVVHGTNYVVAPTSRRALVSVYDCWFLANPQLDDGAVARAGAVLARRVAGGAHVHTSSQASANAVRALLDTDRVTAIHLGPPDIGEAPPQPPVSGLPRQPFVLALGTRERRKNLPRLLQAFALLAEHHDVALVIAGAAGDDDAAVMTAFDRLPARARRRCWLLGAVDAATRSWLLHHAHVIAYPSLDEGFGFPVLEAQLAGVPLVAANVGSIPEVAGEGAALVDPVAVDELSAALVRAVTDHDLRDRLVRDGTTNVQRFSWERTAQEMIVLYRALASGAMAP